MRIDQPTLYPEILPDPLRYPFSRDRLFLTCGLAAVLLFWATFDEGHSDGFYTFLRIYVCGLSIGWAVAFWFLQRPAWSLAAICSAILFNPIFEIHFDEFDWRIIDFVAGAVFGWIALQPYSLARAKPFVPYFPVAAMSAIAFLISIDLGSTRAFGAGESTMNVDETMNAENVIAGAEDAFDDLSPRPQLASPTRSIVTEFGTLSNEIDASNSRYAVDATDPSAELAGSRRVDYSLNTRPDGTIAPKPELGAFDRQRRALDEIFREPPKADQKQPAEPAIANDTPAMDVNAATDQ